jgi:hypothetical protein
MRQSRLAICIILVLLFICPPAFSAETVTTPAEPAAKVKEDDRPPIQKQDQWQFFLAPYMWVPGMNINTTFSGHTSTVSQGWYDMVPRLFSNAIGAMGRFEAWKGKWGIYVDSYFTYLGCDISDSPGKTIDLRRRLNIPVTVVLNGDLKFISRAASVDFGPRYLVGTVSLNPE